MRPRESWLQPGSLHGAANNRADRTRVGKTTIRRLAPDENDGKRWGRLRQELSARGLATALPLELRLAVVVEAGSQFFDFSRPDPTRRGWYAFVPEATNLRFQKVVIEGQEHDSEQNVATDCGGIS
jgi:hypothetical protein